jgi:uncharacterized protein (TIGR04562 family)
MTLETYSPLIPQIDGDFISDGLHAGLDVDVTHSRMHDDFFKWETLQSFMDGISPIDLSYFPVASLSEAERFLLDYGVDLHDEEDLAEAHSVLGEAIEYLHRVLCPAPSPEDVALSLPVELTQIKTLPELLLVASGQESLQPWACAVLRVMHTINHANHAVRSPYYSYIKQQILGRYHQHVTRDEAGQFRLGNSADSVPLVDFSFREEKSRESLILKLLHKPDNVAQSVYDRIGLKLVVDKPLDALLVLRYFRRHNLANFANITPGRSRNTLFSLNKFRTAWAELREDGLSLEAAIQELRKEDCSSQEPQGPTPANPHSAPGFRSIQFTCRQLIRLRNPIYHALKEIAEQPGHPTPQLGLIELAKISQEKVLRFYFPYEVQIMDRESFELSQTGETSHAAYRMRQLRSARRRVLARLLRRPNRPAEPGNRL